MKVICCLVLAALAITADAGMMGGPGGPPMGKGGPPPGIASGPPPFVQAIIAGKGKPFGGPPAAAAPAPEPALPPAYIQSLIAAKAAAASPFMPPMMPMMGPPPFVQQLIAAKNAAAAQAAAEAAAAQQLADLSAPQTMGAWPMKAFNVTSLLPIGPPSFVQDIMAQKAAAATATPAPVATPAAAAPPDWIQQLIQTQIAKKAAAKLPPALSPLSQTASTGYPSMDSSFQRRDVVGDATAQQTGPPSMPGQYPMPFSPYGMPPAPYAPVAPYPFMPMMPPIPFWKLG